MGFIIAIDKPAVVPKLPIKPNKKLIVALALALALALGGMIRVLFVFIRKVVVRNRPISAAS